MSACYRGGAAKTTENDIPDVSAPGPEPAADAAALLEHGVANLAGGAPEISWEAAYP